MGLDFDPAELREAIQTAARLVADFYDGLEDRPVAPSVRREDLRHALGGTLGEDGVGLRRALDEVEHVILPGAMGTAHPGYLGLVNSTPLPGGMVADLIISALNNNGGAYGQSPSLTTAEEEVVRAFRDILGLGDDFGGMLLPGGTIATLQALQLARDRQIPAWREDGPVAVERAPRLYTSDAAHFSVARSARSIGIGDRDVISVPSVGRGAVDIVALAEAIARDRRNDRHPFAVVATIGTTGTGAIDDVDAVADLCEREGLWLHVDACYGGAAVFLDELRDRLDSLRRADSISIDPHKWFFVPMTAGLLLTRHPEGELASFDIDASYIPGDGSVDAYRRGIPTSRRSSGFAVWLAIRAHGWSTVRAAVQRNVELTRQFESLLEAAGFEVLPDGALSIACVRWEPAGLSPERLDVLQEAIAEGVRASGTAWFATVRHRGRIWLRLNMLNLHTRERHVRAIVETMTAVAREAEAVRAGSRSG